MSDPQNERKRLAIFGVTLGPTSICTIACVTLMPGCKFISLLLIWRLRSHQGIARNTRMTPFRCARRTTSHIGRRPHPAISDAWQAIQPGSKQRTVFSVTLPRLYHAAAFQFFVPISDCCFNLCSHRHQIYKSSSHPLPTYSLILHLLYFSKFRFVTESSRGALVN